MAELRATSRLDSRGFRTGMGEIKGEVRGFKSQLGGMKTLIAGAFGFAVFGRFIKGAIDAAGALEDIQTQFAQLMGGADEAREHVQKLAEFSARTPFQLEGIADASRLLFLFSEGALGMEESLTIVGDAAAGANKPIQEVAMWVGRLYAQLQAGAPVGEATMRLMEMGIITPKVKQEIAELTKANADAAVKWQVVMDAFSRFAGQMEAKSKTINGRLSTLRDNWRLAMGDMGNAIKPATSGLVTFGTKAANVFTGLIKSIQRAGSRVGTLFEVMRNDAVTTGDVLEGMARRTVELESAGAPGAGDKKKPSAAITPPKAKPTKEELAREKEIAKLRESIADKEQKRAEMRFSSQEKITAREKEIGELWRARDARHTDDLKGWLSDTDQIRSIEIDMARLQERQSKEREQVTKAEAKTQDRTAQRMAKVEQKTAEKIAAAQRGEGVSVSSELVDMLQRIGGFGRETVSPAARVARRQVALQQKILQVQKEQKTLLSEIAANKGARAA